MKTTVTNLKKSFILVIVLFSACSPTNTEISKDEKLIRQVHKDYVEGWKEMDEEKVMNLLQGNAQIQPNLFDPVTGKDNIREFWFPDDSSKTVINKFITDIISFNLIDSIAITTHRSLLDWDYQKDTLSFGMIQKGYNTTIYKRQKDESWKIWRSMWTDLSFEAK